MRNIVLGIICLCVFAAPAQGQQKLVRILVTSPYIEHELYRPIADVVAGTIIREFKRTGGMEVLDRLESEEIIREDGGDGWVATREQAAFIGHMMEADIVVYSALKRYNDTFKYSIAFYQVEKDVQQRVVGGSFRKNDSPGEIGKIITKEVAKLQRYVPLPSELEDPGSGIRIATVDPDDLPVNFEIEDLPEVSRFGVLERVMAYYRVFPAEMEFFQLAQGTRVMRFKRNDEVFDEELSERFNLYNVYGDFAIRHGMQAFFIDHCSTQAVNLLVANGIPVFYNDDLITGYQSLMGDGFCIFKTAGNQYFDTADMSYHNRMVVLITLPYPGRQGGISREYLEAAVSRFKNEWDETPELVEITEGLLDFDSSPLE